MKICTKCKTEKEYSEFRVRGNGYNSWCKECQRKDTRSRYQPKPKKKKVTKSKEEIKLAAKKRMLKHRYNITYEEYTQMYDNHNKRCAICKTKKKLGGHSGLYVDHNHETNEVRGLLCTKCNSAIGKLKENKEILLEVIKYLKL